MTDNVNITPGSGAIIGADNVGGVYIQRVKVTFGADGTADDVTSTNPLPVTIENASIAVTVGSIALPTGASTAAKQPALGTAGTASADVITVQGVASMTAIAVSLAAGATSIAKAEDVASADADVGVPALAVRKATPANTSGTDGDYEFLQISAGRLWTSGDITFAGTAADTNSGNKSAATLRAVLATDSVAIPTFGHGATAASVPANVTYQGKRGTTALPTAVSDGQSVGAMSDKYGRAVTLLNTIRDLVGTQTTTISASTSETTIATAVASTFLDLVLLVISNTSASTNTRIDFRDTTAGSVLFSLQSNGGQPPIGFALSVPIPQTTVNTNWTAQCATSTTDIRAYAVFCKNK